MLSIGGGGRGRVRQAPCSKEIHSAVQETDVHGLNFGDERSEWGAGPSRRACPPCVRRSQERLPTGPDMGAGAFKQLSRLRTHISIVLISKNTNKQTNKKTHTKSPTFF